MRSKTFVSPIDAGTGRFLLIAVPAMLVLYSFIYFPHRIGSTPERAVSAYVYSIASLAGGVLSIFDRTVAVSGNQIHGRFPVSIILDCSALDTQALYVAAVLGVRSRLSDKAIGIVGGCVTLMMVNLARIVVLYFVGARAPHLFHLFHEEILQIALVVCTLFAFGAWAHWAQARMARAE